MTANTAESARQSLNWVRLGALLVGLAGLAAAGLGAALDPPQFFRSYLFAHFFWVGLALGSLAVALLHFLTGGEWGLPVRHVLEAAAMTLPLMALLFLPVVLGMPVLYEWARPEAVAENPLLAQKSPYLNAPFFAGRAVFYFVVWIGMARWLRSRSQAQDRLASPDPPAGTRRLSALGLILYGLTVTFAAIDWVMSLEPEWYSTIYGMMIAVGQVLGAFALATAVALSLAAQPPVSAAITPLRLNDLGNLLLTFVLLWTYVAFSQFLVIWSGNLPEEAGWYLRRSGGGWEWIVWLLLLFHFLVPLAVLMSRGAKRKAAILLAVSALIVVMQWVNAYWLVMPAFSTDGIRLHWLDLAAPLGLGGVWVAALAHHLGGRPLVPAYDPRLRETPGHG